MTFPLPDPGDAFDPVEGQPGSLRSAATTLGTATTALTKDISTARKAIATATGNWRGKRTQEFKNGILGPQLELAETMAAVEEAGTLVGVLASALTTAQHKVAEEKTKWDALEREAREHPEIDGHDAVQWAKATGLIDAARDAKKTWKTAAERVAGELDDQTDRLVPGGSSLTPESIALKVAQLTGTAGLGGRNPSDADAWRMMAAGAVHAKEIEEFSTEGKDGEGDNRGEFAGGPYSQLPTDVKALDAMRQAMMDAGVTGGALRAVTEQYWTAHAAQSAGIDLDQWDPAFDAKGNQDTIVKVYKFYGELYKKDPNMKWAGLANIVGPIFASGFDDLGMIHQLTDKLQDLPESMKELLPDDIKRVLAAGGQLSGDEVKYFEDKFLAMQKHIFMDLGSQHEAYATQGMTGIKQLREAGAINSSMMDGWNKIDHGLPSEVDEAAKIFADREQNHVIADQYDEMYNHDGVVGEMATYMMTTVGGTVVPGSKTPAQFSHVGIDEEKKTGWGPFSAQEHLKVTTPLPDWNIANREDRWNYIQNDILPNYLAMSPDEVRKMVDTPVEQRIDEQRLSHRWPTIADHLLTDWDVDAGASASAGPITIGIP